MMKKPMPTKGQMKQIWDSDPNVRAEFGDDFEAYEAYTEADAKGLVRFYRCK